jgi:hypothetical protein
VLSKAFGSAVPPTHLCIQWVPWVASGLNGGGVNLTSYLHVVPKGKNVWSYTSTALHGTHSGNFTFTLLVTACDILQHVVGHMGPSVVGCSVRRKLYHGGFFALCRSQWSVQKAKYASIARAEWPGLLCEVWCRVCTGRYCCCGIWREVRNKGGWCLRIGWWGRYLELREGGHNRRLEKIA